ncbi:MAG: ComEC/Rec2 family competence protein [Lachnospiraceae bacterium]|nr:ComEC/Rec2 family competence protein [Lachnospiraceae bacterium]
MKRPLFWASLFAILGVTVAYSEPGTVTVLSGIAFLVTVGSLVVVRRIPLSGLIMPVSFVFGVLVCVLYMRHQFRATEALFGMSSLKGRVVRTESSWFAAEGSVTMSHGQAKVTILAYADESNMPVCGDIVELKGPFAGFDHAQNDGEWDAYSYYTALGYTARAETFSVTDEHVDSLRTWLSQKRDLLRRRVELLYEESTAPIAKAILYCDRSDVERDTSDRYRHLGLAHILAVSGIHIAVLGGLLSGVLVLILRKPASDTVTGLLLLCYGALTGFPVSCIRAVFWYLTSGTARVLRRTPDKLTATTAVAAVLLFRRPEQLSQSGFWMSFYCAYVLLALSARKAREKKAAKAKEAVMPKPKETLRSKVAGALYASVTFQIYLIPVQAFFFYRISPFGCLLGPLVIAVFGVILTFAACGVIMSTVWLVGGRFLSAMPHFAILLMNGATQILQKIPLSSFVTGRPSVLNYAAYGFVVVAAMVLRRRKQSGKTLALCALLAYLCFLPIRSSELRIYNLSVGQGDCAVVTKGGACIVIDCGSTSRNGVGDRVLKPFLEYHGFSEPDLVVVTHADADHVNGLTTFLTEDWRCVCTLMPDVALYGEYGTKLRDGGAARLFAASYGDVITVRDRNVLSKIRNPAALTVTVLHPDGGDYVDEGEDGRNDSGIIVSVTDERTLALFAADAPAEVLERLTEEGRLDGSGYDYLKVAHHGSYYSVSDSFYETVRPKIAVISVGKNSYGHPSDVVIERLRSLGAEVFVTLADGQVTVRYPEGKPVAECFVK